jgi:hypothetical protein
MKLGEWHQQKQREAALDARRAQMQHQPMAPMSPQGQAFMEYGNDVMTGRAAGRSLAELANALPQLGNPEEVLAGGRPEMEGGIEGIVDRANFMGVGAMTRLEKGTERTRREANIRAREANEFLDQPTEPWVAKEYAFSREPIKEAVQGWPGVQQTKWQRYEPKKDLSYVDEVYTDPANRDLIKKQIARGLPLGGETFYASLYPLYLASMERGIPANRFNSWVEGTAGASARNSIMNENAVGNMLARLAHKGEDLTNPSHKAVNPAVEAEKLRFREDYGIGLPLMPVHVSGVQGPLQHGVSLGQKMQHGPLAKDAINYKIPTYGKQKTGDFAHSWVGDVHEAAGETLGSRRHNYFKEQGGFGKEEYGRAEQHMLDIANEMGLAGGQAQAGRWFGGGELTGLVSPRGDALDILEKQAAYTLKHQGKEVTPASVREYILNLVEQGGDLLPWYSKSPMPDVRF